MDKNDAFTVRLDLLKLEIKILDSRITNVVSNLWKVRQLGLTLWLAALGVGFGALSQGSKPLINVLILSGIVPLIFSYMDARITRWYTIFRMRDLEIQHFINQKEYVLPSSNAKLSFDESLENQTMDFPVYDLTGKQTFGDNKFYKWNTTVKRSFLAATPVVFYGLQILASALFTSIELSNARTFRLWWIIPTVTLVLIVTLRLATKLRGSKLAKLFWV